MSGIKIYNAGFNGVRLSKGITVEEFKSWIVSSLGGDENDLYYWVTPSNDGGYVAVGFQESQSQGYRDALIVKYDKDLNVVIQKALGGSSYDDYRSVIQTNDGGYVAVGVQQSQGQGNNDALIVKYDSDLNVVTQKGLGGTANDYYQSVIQTTDGGYVAVGYQRSYGEGNNDALIVKYDSDLNVIAQKGLGGSLNEYYYSVMQTTDGGYVAVGYGASQGQGNNDALIVKYDSDLNVVTQKCLGGSSSEYYYSVMQTTDGGYVAVGNQNSQVSSSLIVKYDSDLNVVTQKGLGESNSNTTFRSVMQTTDGGYVAVGTQNAEAQGSSDALMVKYDSELNVVAQKGLGGWSVDTYRHIIQSNDGGYVTVGNQNSQTQGSSDALIIKHPTDFTLMDGSLSNHSGLTWTTPTLTEHTLTLVETTLTLNETVPMLTITSPTLVETTSTLVETRSEKP